MAVVGCEPADGGATLELDGDHVVLPRGARILDVGIGGAGAIDSIAPSMVEARPGDVVRFSVQDHRTHAIAFVADALTPEARAFLEQTTQLRGPPLVSEGAAWIVSLEDAPPGRYPFVCRAHGASAVLTVTDG